MPDAPQEHDSGGFAQTDIVEVESSREKSLRRGHIAAIHRWWARQTCALARVATYLAITEEQKPNPEFLASLGSVNPQAHTLADAWSRIRDASWGWALQESSQRGGGAPNEIAAPSSPRVLDPFAGGGSIPLEASRLGLKQARFVERFVRTPLAQLTYGQNTADRIVDFE